MPPPSLSPSPPSTRPNSRGGVFLGVGALNRSLREQAQQDVRRHAAGCWVMVDSREPAIVLGFYTLSADSVLRPNCLISRKLQGRNLPHYDKLGAILIGRLAVAKSAQGQGLGKRLLLRRAPPRLHHGNPRCGGRDGSERREGRSLLREPRVSQTGRRTYVHFDDRRCRAFSDSGFASLMTVSR